MPTAAKKPEIAPSCWTCMFYAPRPDKPQMGLCRRYPPDSNQLQPSTTANNWCGEHKEK